MSDLNGAYNFEHGIIEMCENKLKDLNNHNLEIEPLKSKINSNDLWECWTTLRAKSIFEDTISMNIDDIDKMTPQAIWEYNKGEKVNKEDINKALKQKLNCVKQIDEIFNNEVERSITIGIIIEFIKVPTPGLYFIVIQIKQLNL
mgnify:CR=1 FL=1